ncbi:N-acetylmuramoyl-L-alanine amidase [Metabacillus dongyingensis]|uniref:N-acetylmuramoyl-L-alanine amidase n=1 Tax=Metabacillus dongyingensis TaxID=2874282 RepID=UPI001CBCD873|nr:N-acetylmuramoyl-L-alanine amidase [Metabacillus dongyingensis]UAL52030.1 N-acetylmuramoyl-L-alanine amidase [Metabacillus dongyingensis]
MKKLLTSVIAVFLLAAGMIEFWTPQKAEASTVQFTYYAKNEFESWTGPGDRFPKAGRVEFQTAFKVKKGGIKGGWAEIQLSGRTMYAKAEDITNKKPSQPVYFNYYTKEPVSFYGGRGTQSKRYGSIAEDAVIKVAKGTVLNGWVEIHHKGTKYYADYSKLTSAQPVFFTYYAVKDFTLYNERNTKTPKTKIAPGSVVKVKQGSVIKGWSRIEYNGVKGYAPYSSISSKPKYFTYYANKNTSIYSSKSTASSVLANLTRNGQMKIRQGGISNGWAEADYNGKTGYLKSSDIVNKPVAAEEITPEELKYYVRENLSLRSQKSTSSSIILTIPQGKEVKVLNPSELKDDWASVIYNGKTGYVSAKYLTLEPIAKETELNKVIVLDPGHGGKDPGAIGNGLQEKDITLAVGKLTADKLKKLGYDVHMTRTDDTYLSLNERTDFSYSKSAGVFVSIHMNSSTAPSANGTETFATNGSSSFSTASMTDKEKADSAKLAVFIQSRLVKALDTRNRGIKEEAFYVIDKNYTRSVLIEMGFISNKNDASIFKTNDGKDGAAEAIAQGINDFYQWKKNN